MIEIREVKDTETKLQITDKVLHALPNWFGPEQSIQEYVKNSGELPFFAVFDSGEPIGLLAAKIHNAIHGEIYVMGIMEEYHRISIGRGLFNTFQNYCLSLGLKYLSVKTLAETKPNIHYDKTRQYYKAMGFEPFEVSTDLWSVEIPCLVMIKDLRDADNSYKCKHTEER